MSEVFDFVKINASTRHIFKILDQNGIDLREMYLLSEILKRKSERWNCQMLNGFKMNLVYHLQNLNP